MLKLCGSVNIFAGCLTFMRGCDRVQAKLTRPGEVYKDIKTRPRGVYKDIKTRPRGVYKDIKTRLREV